MNGRRIPPVRIAPQKAPVRRKQRAGTGIFEGDDDDEEIGHDDGVVRCRRTCVRFGRRL